MSNLSLIKNKVLIVDDSETNRAILVEIYSKKNTILLRL